MRSIKEVEIEFEKIKDMTPGESKNKKLSDLMDELEVIYGISIIEKYNKDVERDAMKLYQSIADERKF